LISLLVQHGIELDNEVDLKSQAYNSKFETLEALYPLALSCETPTGMVVNQSSSLSVFLYNRSDQELAFINGGSIKLLLPFGNSVTDVAELDKNTGNPVHVGSTHGTLKKINSSSNKSVFFWQPVSGLVIEKGGYLELKIGLITPSKNLGRCFIDARISGLIGQQDNQFSLPLTKISPDLAQLSGNQNVGIGTGTEKPKEALEVQGNILSSGNIFASSYINASSKIKEGGHDLIPKGVIAMFHFDKNSSYKIPAGWALCDGSNETPNLINKFVRGSATLSSSIRTGGASSVRLSLNQMPEHNHTATDSGHYHSVDDPGHSHNYSKSTDGRSDNANDRDVHRSHSNRNTSNDKTNIKIKEGKANISIGHKGGNSSFSIIPPYYELCYIMKL
jgi:microcystin-dependent protein